ncbi:hypothetical protein HanRHA438_Chr06g0274891 [Helianthus annuus]|nr:hypothetical protein HanRHA438_Chr06g0274891 [Helianthus annuus]
MNGLELVWKRIVAGKDGRNTDSDINRYEHTTDRAGVIPIRSERLYVEQFTVVSIGTVPSSLNQKLRNFTKL